MRFSAPRRVASWVGTLPCLVRAATVCCAVGMAAPAWAAHGFALYGDLKYAPGFTHFDYANPQAPRGGTLTLANPDRRTSFDKFNPITIKGVSAPGLESLMFETLLTASADETASAYGLLAEDVTVAPDGLSITFRLRPEARFSNGDPVLAADVKYSYDMVRSKFSIPAYRSLTEDVARVTVTGPRTIRYDLRQRNREMPLILGALPVFSPKWGGGKPFDQLTFEAPVASGPYLIERYTAGRNITYRRNPAYWGNHLNVRRGLYNFERVTYRMYADETVRLEAFKAGEFDAIVENRAKLWVKSYTGKRFRNGELTKQEFAHRNSAGMQGFLMNVRRPQFQDRRVRQALGLAMDFQWLNRQLFYGAYQRIDSWFTNSDLAAVSSPGTRPDAGELKLLEPLRTRVPAEVFGPAAIPPSTDPPGSLRENLREARRLLAEAGWTYRDGALRNAAGTPFHIEFLEDGGAMSRVITAYVRNLDKLGIRVTLRTTDYVLYQKRMDSFDYDMASMRFPDSQSPGNELLDRFGSAAADVQGSSNIIGVKSPAVDALVNHVLRADTREQLVTAARALDRVLMHNYYAVPHWYSAVHRVAYRRSLGIPATLPKYYAAEPWIVALWWDGAQKK
ncbi:ABC transporter substrate-binding protein [Imbroritus primus]|uniref:ABC transporter substrate-binding protein n=1 Tax=Imbroritus primus TaxID=3058603 RepID=A0ACD3SMV2_9BURK|nr:ABC transporter substrate-binding protein [Burkholderiaceae bacterium PBA]